MTSAAPSRYPPADHILRDLQVAFEAGPGRAVVAPVVPEVLHEGGSIHAGALGILLDVMGGAYAIRAVTPDWAVTSDLQLHVGDPVSTGTLVGRGNVLRSGRTTIVLELDLLHRESGALAAHSTMSFTRIQRRDPAPDISVDDARPTGFATPGSRLEKPLFEAAGIELLDAKTGRARVAVRDYVRNSVGALQGGVVLVVAEAAAEALARHACGEALVVSDLGAHYIAMVKVGPIGTRARLLRQGRHDALVRVELVDEGDGDRLLSAVTARLAPPPTIATQS